MDLDEASERTDMTKGICPRPLHPAAAAQSAQPAPALLSLRLVRMLRRESETMDGQTYGQGEDEDACRGRAVHDHSHADHADDHFDED